MKPVYPFFLLLSIQFYFLLFLLICHGFESRLIDSSEMYKSPENNTNNANNNNSKLKRGQRNRCKSEGHLTINYAIFSLINHTHYLWTLIKMQINQCIRNDAMKWLYVFFHVIFSVKIKTRTKLLSRNRPMKIKQKQNNKNNNWQGVNCVCVCVLYGTVRFRCHKQVSLGCCTWQDACDPRDRERDSISLHVYNYNLDKSSENVHKIHVFQIKHRKITQATATTTTDLILRRIRQYVDLSIFHAWSAYSRHFNGIHMFITCNCFAHCYANFNLLSMLLSFVPFYKRFDHDSSIETWHFLYFIRFNAIYCICLAKAREGIFRKLDDNIEIGFDKMLNIKSTNTTHIRITALVFKQRSELWYQMMRFFLSTFKFFAIDKRKQTIAWVNVCTLLYIRIVQSSNHNNNHVLKVYLFIFYEIASICQHTASTCDPIGSHHTQMWRWREI